MTLEDLFTLTEMKDGLTAPARIKELIDVMQKEKDCTVKNIGDAARQWSAVSNTIATTDNKDCLDIFIKLDGLFFIDRWLKDAQKFDTDTSKSFVEEAIYAMLGALEKLQIDSGRSKSSGIWVTVKNLIGHSSSRIHDRARELIDHWSQGGANDIANQDSGGVNASHVDVITVSSKHSVEGGNPECLPIDASLSKEHGNESCSVGPVREEVLPSNSSGNHEAGGVEEAWSHTHSNHLNSYTIIGDRDPLPAFVEKTSTREEPPVSTTVGTVFTESCTSAPEQCSVGQIHAPNLTESTEDTKNSPDRSGQGEIYSGSSVLGSRVVELGIDVANVQESAGKPALLNNVCANDVEGVTLKSEPKSGVDDLGSPNYCNTWSSETAGGQAESCTVLEESSGKENNLSAPMDVETSRSKTENCKSPSRDEDTPPCFDSEALNVSMKKKMEDSGSAYEEKDRVSDAEESLIRTPKFTKPVKGVRNPDSIKSVRDSRNPDSIKSARDGRNPDSVKSMKGSRNSDSIKPVKCSRKSDSTKTVKGARNTDFIDKRIAHFTEPVKDARKSDIEFDYGILDALEVACQVAQEVEREVVNYRRQSCSYSSDKASEGGTGEPGTPDSINENEDKLISGSPEKMMDRQSISTEEYRQGEEEGTSKSESMDTEPESCLPDIESSQVTEAAQEPEAHSERGDMCGFDLNQEICSDDMDSQVNAISTLVSVVSASRPAVSPGLPVAPLQFEGTLGWKGSALTSAFRPASPRRVSDGGESSNGLRCRKDHLDIDLNVTEEEDKFGDLISGRQRHTFFGLHSGESSVEISSKRRERLKLDLNCIGDDGDDFRKEKHLFHHQNGRRSPSPASSSSSMQPFMRNIDLNSGPFIQNDSLGQGAYLARPSQNISAYGSTKPDDPVISIMGTRVEVKRKDFVPQTISFLNGTSPEFSMDANMARTTAFLGMGPTLSYAHPPAFGYNGFTGGPPMSFSSSMYGAGIPIPYMVDSRGAPVVPQVISSATAIPTYSQQPFIMNMTGASLSLNVVDPSRPNLDLNYDFATEGGNRDSSSLRQFLVPGQGRSMEEHLRINSLPTSSVVGNKRKDHDGWWEPYPFNYKHQQPPWK